MTHLVDLLGAAFWGAAVALAATLLLEAATASTAAGLLAGALVFATSVAAGADNTFG